KVKKETGDYAKYLQARILKLEKNLPDAVKTLLRLSPNSSWFAAPERTRPTYRGSKAAEVLLSNLGALQRDSQNASNILAKDPALKQETLDQFHETAGPAIQPVVRAQAFDPLETEKKLAPLKQLLESFAPPLDKLAEKALKDYEAESLSKTSKKAHLDLALECAEGFKAVGGDRIEAARLLG